MKQIVSIFRLFSPAYSMYFIHNPFNMDIFVGITTHLLHFRFVVSCFVGVVVVALCCPVFPSSISEEKNEEGWRNKKKHRNHGNSWACIDRHRRQIQADSLGLLYSMFFSLRPSNIIIYVWPYSVCLDNFVVVVVVVVVMVWNAGNGLSNPFVSLSSVCISFMILCFQTISILSRWVFDFYTTRASTYSLIRMRAWLWCVTVHTYVFQVDWSCWCIHITLHCHGCDRCVVELFFTRRSFPAAWVQIY